MLTHTSLTACFEHFVFLTVNDLDHATNPVKGRDAFQNDGHSSRHNMAEATGQEEEVISSTTSLLTATTLIYAIGAGITAAAGTRLALQWILVNDFRLYSFQLPDL